MTSRLTAGTAAAPAPGEAGRHGGQGLQVGAERHVRTDNRPGRGTDDHICRRQIHPRPAQADDDSSLPGDPRYSAAAKHHTPSHTPSLPLANGPRGAAASWAITQLGRGASCHRQSPRRPGRRPAQAVAWATRRGTHPPISLRPGLRPQRTERGRSGRLQACAPADRRPMSGRPHPRRLAAAYWPGNHALPHQRVNIAACV